MEIWGQKHNNWSEKKLLKGFKSIFELAEERNSKLEDILIQIIQLEDQREKKNKKSKQGFKEMWDSINLTNICIRGRIEGEEREKGTEKNCLKNNS